MKTAPNEPITQTFHSDGSVMTKQSYEPAFEQFIGLTKREYFAAMALQGMITTVEPTPISQLEELPTNVASWAVKYADALIAQLNND